MTIRRACRVLGIGLSACFLGCGGGGGGGAPAITPAPPPAPTSLALAQVFAGVNLVSPVGLLQAPGDNTRWFAIEQAGFVWVFDNDPNVSSQTMFLDITNLVRSGGESGLLGMAFHPNFGAGNFYVYVSYTRQGAPIESVVSRFASNDGGLTLDPLTETIIMTIAQDDLNHNGGQLAFGPDGFLYGGWGDGGGAGDPLERAQQTNNLLGTFTRIDVDSASPYAIPPDNPFAGNTECGIGGFGPAACPEIFAFGLRNPWRWSFDRETGDLWAGDVGQSSWEEIDRIEISMNYGWDQREGAHCFEPLSGCDTNNVDPITEYGHPLGISVTGGYVYRGTDIPSLVGNYIFGDFGSGLIWSVPATSGIGTAFTDVMDSALSISSFAEDNNGELYVLDYFSGEIYQFVSQ